MRLGSLFRDDGASGPVVHPDDHRLMSGTPESMAEARRELVRNQRNAAIVRTKREIPRRELDFSRYWIEHIADPDGARYRPFGGVAEYSTGIEHFYFTAAGDAVMLERVGSRREAEENRAAAEQRKAARAAEAKQRRAQYTAGRG